MTILLFVADILSAKTRCGEVRHTTSRCWWLRAVYNPKNPLLHSLVEFAREEVIGGGLHEAFDVLMATALAVRGAHLRRSFGVDICNVFHYSNKMIFFCP
jgi:hypothetical protein